MFNVVHQFFIENLSLNWTKIKENYNENFSIEHKKNTKQCRERWENYLDPSFENGPVNQENEAEIWRIYSIYGPKWATISVFTSKYSPNIIKNYVSQTLSDLKTYLKKEISIKNLKISMLIRE